jgi:tRNA(fMet)-specific endonuclease VapC
VIFLDTDSCARLIKGGSKRLDAKVRATPPREVCISEVTRAELLLELARHPEEPRLAELVQAFLACVRSLPWSGEAATHYAQIRSLLEARKEAPGLLDQMIAAHARSLGMPLATVDAKRFRPIKGLEVLDWS